MYKITGLDFLLIDRNIINKKAGEYNIDTYFLVQR